MDWDLVCEKKGEILHNNNFSSTMLFADVFSIHFDFQNNLFEFVYCGNYFSGMRATAQSLFMVGVLIGTQFNTSFQ